jgi:DNA-binding MarR family transcriptional regulator
VDDVAAEARLPGARLPDGLGEDLGWLLGQVQHGYLKAAAAAAGDLPGGLRGVQVLAAAVQEAPRSQIELARRFCIDRTVMVRLIDDLERAGLVERHPDPADRRARLIVATRRGVATHAAVRERMRAVEDHVLAPLAEPERAAFLDRLRSVVVHLVSVDPSHGTAACKSVEGQLAALDGGREAYKPC